MKKKKIGPGTAARSTPSTPAVDGMEVNYLATSSSCTDELYNWEHTGWVEIEGLMVSGVADSVVPPSVLPQVPMTPSAGSSWPNVAYGKGHEACESGKKKDEIDLEPICKNTV